MHGADLVTKLWGSSEDVYHTAGSVASTTIIIIIIALKGAIQDFFTISSLRREPSPTCTLKWPKRNHVQIVRNTSSAYHVEHAMLRATWYEETAQLLSLTELKSHLFELYLTG